MLEYDPFMPAVVAGDPYAVYRQLRHESPRLYNEAYNAWFLSSFDDVWNLSKHESLAVGGGLTPTQLLLGGEPNPLMISQMDPPVHPVVRAPLNRMFRPAAVAEMTDAIAGYARQRLAGFSAGMQVDLVNDYASYVAGNTACLVSGLPHEDVELFIRWVGGFFHRRDDHRGDTEVGAQSGAALFDYIREFVGRIRRGEETARAVTAEVFDMEVDGRRFDEDGLVSMIANIQIAASDTVPKGIAATLYRLWQHPEARRRVIDEPSLAEVAFNEAVRLDMPTQMQGRVCTADFEYDGMTFRQGQRVMFLFAAANRDPAEFDEPDSYRLDRQPKRVLNYGNGPHRCLGVHLAALTGSIAVNELLAAYPDYRIDESASWPHKTEYVKGWAQLAATL